MARGNQDEPQRADETKRVRLYLDEIERCPVLSAQQEVELALRIESGRRAQERVDGERHRR